MRRLLTAGWRGFFVVFPVTSVSPKAGSGAAVQEKERKDRRAFFEVLCTHTRLCVSPLGD